MCEGTYVGHLQGIAIDQDNTLYWSFTVALVKTDTKGYILKSVPVQTHHGDITWNNGKLYVAVNFGLFNREPGFADSWVYVYDANDLSVISTHEVPELVHGAGGIAYNNGRFAVIGGLPVGYEENYVYEYDENFNFIQRHTLQSGYTVLGIQTACYHNGFWWFGCYGNKLLQTSDSFQLLNLYGLDFGVGIVGLSGDRFFKGVSLSGYRGKVVPFVIE